MIKFNFMGIIFSKKGGNHFGKGGGTDPLSPPPPKSALAKCYFVANAVRWGRPMAMLVMGETQITASRAFSETKLWLFVVRGMTK